ncbi:SCAN domain-containing protein 3 [Trichonephila clavipes]|nr:SCAN domain-containing protein 3 [Trichonephila clavipes]
MRHPTRPEINATEGLQEPSSELRHFHWPPKSSDMNIIQYIWDVLQRAVQKRSPTPLTPTDLWTALQDSCFQLPPALLQTLIKSMLHHVAELLRAHGGPYKINRNMSQVGAHLPLLRTKRVVLGIVGIHKILLKMDKWLKRRKFNDDNSDNDNVRDQVNEPTPAQAQVASYEIAELIAVNLKPHNLAEEIILPACRKIVKTMIGGSADIDICKIPLSNDTIHRRIKDMSENIEQNTAKTLANSNFALQVDETTDITGNAQLIAFIRFIHENDIINQLLCCRELPDFTTGKHIFQVISSYLEEIEVSWKSCIGIWTDGAPAMTGHLKGFVAHVKELNEDILVTHCFLHREALVTKFFPSDLKIVLEQCVKMVNYIKSRPLKSRLFSKLCQAMEAKY